MATLSTKVAEVPLAQLAIGESASLSIEEFPDLAISWSSTDPAIASVDPSGTVTGRAPGRATVIGRYRDGSVVCRIVVRAASLASRAPRTDPIALAFSRQALSLSERETVNLAGTVAISGADAQTAAESGALVWDVRDPSVARISDSGLVQALRAGQTLVTARLHGVTASIPLEVLPARVVRLRFDHAPASVTIGSSIALQVTPLGVDDDRVEGRLVSWHSTAPDVIAVSADGVARSLAPGVATISAECGSTRTAVSIRAERQERVGEITAPDSLPVAPRAPRSRRGWVAGAAAVLATAALWAVATRTSDGDASATAPPPLDPAPITATPDASAASEPAAKTTAIDPPSTDVPVDPGTTPLPVRAEILLTTTRLEPGDSARLAWRVLSSDGRPVPVTAPMVRWSTSDAAVLSIDPARASVLAGRPGTATLSLRYGPLSDRRVVTVTPPTVQTLQLQVDRESLQVGERGTWQLLAFDRRGAAIAVSADSASASPADVLEVTGGTFVGLGPGVGTITVLAAGHSVTRGITVRPRPGEIAARDADQLADDVVAAIRRQARATLADIFLPTASREPFLRWLGEARAVRVEGSTTLRQVRETETGAIYQLRVPVRWSGSRGTPRGAAPDTLSIQLRVSAAAGTSRVAILGVTARFLP